MARISSIILLSFALVVRETICDPEPEHGPGFGNGFPKGNFEGVAVHSAGGGYDLPAGGYDLPPPPIVPVVEPVPPLGGLGGLGGIPAGLFPFLGPSYVPQSLFGSALGAKGDILFPLVIFIFFIVGVWVVIQFLLTLIVPIIGAKLGAKALLLKKVLRRDAGEEADDDFNDLTEKVHSAVENGAAKNASSEKWN